MVKITMLSIIVTLGLVLSSHAYRHGYDTSFRFKCKDKESIDKWSSKHDDKYEDRTHDFRCRQATHLQGNATCGWTTGFLNNYDEPLAHQCRDGGYINGIYSDHSDWYQDRKFKLRCCRIPGAIQTNCRFSSFNIHYETPINYIVPRNRVLAGVVSSHRNQHEDRKWSFLTCEMKTCS